MPWRQAVDLQAASRQPLLGLAAQFRRLVARRLLRVASPAPTVKRGRIGLRVSGRKAQRSRDLDGGGQRLRQIGEQHRHLRARLEAMIGGQVRAVGLGDQPPFGDAEQRVMRLVIVGGGEIGLVGRDQRQALGVGEVDQRRLDAALGLDAVALQLDIEPVAEQRSPAARSAAPPVGLIGSERQRDRAVRAAGQRDQALGLAFERVELDVRRLVRSGVSRNAREFSRIRLR